MSCFCPGPRKKRETQQPQACQTCHFKDRDHAVVTPWGFLAVKLPLPEDKQWAYAYPFADLLTFHDAPTTLEQRLFLMFLEHRMRTFQGVFRANPNDALCYGWSEMQRDLTEIKTKAAERRAGTKKAK